MTMTIPARMGKRYECRNGILGQGGSSVFHDKGDGSPTRKKCSYCGGDFEVFEGLYGAFEWVQGGRYEPAAALYWGTKRDAVDNWIEANGGNYVSRWIDASTISATAAIGARPQPGDMVRLNNPRHLNHGQEGRLRFVRPGGKADVMVFGAGVLTWPYDSLEIVEALPGPRASKEARQYQPERKGVPVDLLVPGDVILFAKTKHLFQGLSAPNEFGNRSLLLLELPDGPSSSIEVPPGSRFDVWNTQRIQGSIEAHGTCRRCHEKKILAGAGTLCQDCLDAIKRGEPLERLEGAKVASQIDDLIGEFAKALPASSDDEILKVWGLASDMQRQTKSREAQDALAAFRGVIMAEMQRRGIESRASKTAADDIGYGWSGGLLSSLWHRFLEWLLMHNGTYDTIDGAFASLNAHASYESSSVEDLTQAYYAAVSEARENLDRWGEPGQGPRQTIYAIEAEFDRRNLPRPAWPKAAAKVVHNPCPNCGEELRFLRGYDERTEALYDDIVPWVCDGCGLSGTADDLTVEARMTRPWVKVERVSREALVEKYLVSEANQRSLLPGDPIPTANPDHQPVVPPMAGIAPYCTCGFVGGNGTDRPLLADHLKEHDPDYGRRVSERHKRASNESTCPACGAEAVEYQPYPSAQLVCNACGWSGQRPPEGVSWDCANEWHSRCQGCACSHHQPNRIALNEQKAPPEVDTLRDEQCPVCGEMDGYSGDECAVCGYKKPPSFGMDPDTERASQEDLRKDQGTDEDAQGGLEQFRVDGPAADGTNAPGDGLERFRVAATGYCPDCNSDKAHPRFRIGRGRCRHPFHTTKAEDLPKAASADDPYGPCVHCGHLGHEHTGSGCKGCKAANMVECRGFEDARRYAAKDWPSAPEPTALDYAFGDWWAKHAHITDEDVAWDTFVAVSGERAR